VLWQQFIYHGEKKMTNDSYIAAVFSGLLYPFIIVFGIYLLINGHITPGGGFQGGAILASVFIVRYLEHPENDMDWSRLVKIEKFFLIAVILIASLLLLQPVMPDLRIAREPYLILMNGLIGFKVCCGLSILFVRFLFYESR
jgi:multicomponent Na+:H+ antiporter subunit B